MTVKSGQFFMNQTISSEISSWAKTYAHNFIYKIFIWKIVLKEGFPLVNYISLWFFLHTFFLDSRNEFQFLNLAPLLLCSGASKFSLLLKLNYPKKVFCFAINFLPWEFLLIKKFDFQKTKYTTFKTDLIKVVLVFSISNFF